MDVLLKVWDPKPWLWQTMLLKKCIWSTKNTDVWLFFPTCFSFVGCCFGFFSPIYCLSCTNLILFFFANRLPYIITFSLYFSPFFVVVSFLPWSVAGSSFDFFSLAFYCFPSTNLPIPSLPFSFFLASFLMRIESYQADVEWHCEETGVLLHHWRHQQLCYAQQR